MEIPYDPNFDSIKLSVYSSQFERLGSIRNCSSTIVLLGANIQKDGATGAGVLKILLILGLCKIDYMNFSTLALIILTAILSGIVMGKVPGTGVSAAILMISMFNLPNERMSIIILLSTLFDIPATVLNSVDNIPSAIFVDQIIFRKIKRTVS
ncbi:cation:dicarboxylase symporter family transporter [Enterococcus hulanensis]|uniref:cation:dicarboxylate symporter family transporter n=1 Tax=Enterococcus hulanensis TaxID=2559929 RepID=UPI001A8F9E1C|nr:cation:dicarboxylase symporter family transporter [Enterococcus hulanensis]MBO0459907.1 cation:dicarboxylase symporter family transporter [Enterococcus hulanensis]